MRSKTNGWMNEWWYKWMRNNSTVWKVINVCYSFSVRFINPNLCKFVLSVMLDIWLASQFRWTVYFLQIASTNFMLILNYYKNCKQRAKLNKFGSGISREKRIGKSNNWEKEITRKQNAVSIKDSNRTILLLTLHYRLVRCAVVCRQCQGCCPRHR